MCLEFEYFIFENLFFLALADQIRQKETTKSFVLCLYILVKLELIDMILL